MDDDDIYGEHYLTDQLAALRYSNADLVGKQAHYLHLRNRDIVMCRFPEREHRFTDLVMADIHGEQRAVPTEPIR